MTRNSTRKGASAITMLPKVASDGTEGHQDQNGDAQGFVDPTPTEVEPGQWEKGGVAGDRQDPQGKKAVAEDPQQGYQ